MVRKPKTINAALKNNFGGPPGVVFMLSKKKKIRVQNMPAQNAQRIQKKVIVIN